MEITGVFFPVFLNEWWTNTQHNVLYKYKIVISVVDTIISIFWYIDSKLKLFVFALAALWMFLWGFEH